MVNTAPCPQCGTLYPITETYCAECSVTMPANWFVPKAVADNGEDDRISDEQAADATGAECPSDAASGFDAATNPLRARADVGSHTSTSGAPQTVKAATALCPRCGATAAQGQNCPQCDYLIPFGRSSAGQNGACQDIAHIVMEDVRISVPRGEELLIGRQSNLEQISAAFATHSRKEWVSKRHCYISIDRTHALVTVRDAGSTNGTRVGDDPQLLQSNEQRMAYLPVRIHLGKSVFFDLELG